MRYQCGDTPASYQTAAYLRRLSRIEAAKPRETTGQVDQHVCHPLSQDIPWPNVVIPRTMRHYFFDHSPCPIRHHTLSSKPDGMVHAPMRHSRERPAHKNLKSSRISLRVHAAGSDAVSAATADGLWVQLRAICGCARSALRSPFS